MDIKKILIQAIKQFKTKKLLRASASIDAEILLSYILKKSKEYLCTYPEKNLTKNQCARFFLLIKRRLQYEPIAYIIGKKEFYGRNFFVNKNVLIPRPETEMLVEEVMKYCYGLRVESSGQNLQSAKLIAQSPKLTIADIGTGSGCISIALAKEIPCATIYATDISRKALVIAKKNAKTHNAKISFYKGNILQPLKKKKIDIIVANLPYLNFKEKNVYRKILRHEPRQALYAKQNGLKYYQELFRQIHEYKLFPYFIACEILPKQRNDFKKIITGILPSYKAEFVHSSAIIKKSASEEKKRP